MNEFHTFISMYYVTKLVTFAFDNGDKLSPKRHVFISLLFILKCFTKSSVHHEIKYYFTFY